ncbi:MULTISPECIES: hypothetical protein [unclassified Chryseobacterium]|uniref:hypothetical protein n=1 Tax=unclassified Chryseobacterium TaxID=2593645 RepID=UPI0028533B98|nr:hypothetical protein [Chryseobacterium sp. CFS7]MDR4894428.1 hypothetical protein [Chryseobacterium sp. CFS7]
MAELRNRVMFFLLMFCSLLCFSQSKMNLIIVIDDNIIIDRLPISFINKKQNNSVRNFTYTVGKEIQLDEKFIEGDEFILKFKYSNYIDKDYNYNINIMGGLILDTPYLIVRIYNLDKKKFKKKYCHSNEDYVVELQNSTLYGQIPICR